MGLLIAVVGTVAGTVTGCVGMPSNGAAAEFTATPQSTQQENNFTGPFSAPGPAPNENPSQIVTGFLFASAAYPTYSHAAAEYLVGSVARTWNPSSVTVYSEFNTTSHGSLPPTAPHGAPRAWVDISVSVQATLNGSGQYVSAQAQSSPPSQFILVKVNGQWRIQNPPSFRMVNANDFQYYYKAQDLYFFDQPDATLVPDSVFVPLGVSPQTLAYNLVSALIAKPTTPWLAGAADSEFPGGTKVVSVNVDGATATVDLGGAAASAGAESRLLMAAQLVWTLTGSPASPPNIQSVVLEIDGKPFVPASPPCDGGSGQGSSFQTQAAYYCYNPYLPAPASFYYVDQQQSWSRCGEESAAVDGLIGPPVPLVDHTGALSASQCSGGPSVSVTAPGTPPAQPHSLRLLSMAAVSPDGRFLAIVSPGRDALYVGALSGSAASFPKSPRVSGAGITAMSWGTDDDLWVAQGGSIFLVRAATSTVDTQANFTGGNVTDLSVAPDGVRIAVIISGGGSEREIKVAAINPSGQPQATDQLHAPSPRPSISAGVPLAAGLTDPIALTWYGADNLVVLNQLSSVNSLWEVPVDGQSAQGPLVTPPGTISITAAGPANVLVAGLSGTRLAVSTGLEGPWQTLYEQGQNPAYSG
jgi:hypothetical protein